MSFCYNLGDRSNIYGYFNPNMENRIIKNEERDDLINELKEIDSLIKSS